MKRNSEFVGIDEQFIPEDEKYVDESILGDEEQEKNKIKKFLKIGLGAWAVLVLVVIVFFVIIVISIFNHSKNMNKKIYDMYNNASEQIFDLYDNAVEQMEDGDQQNSINQMNEIQENMNSIQLIIPSNKEMENYNINVSFIFRYYKILVEENEKLTKLQSLLLAKMGQ